MPPTVDFSRENGRVYARGSGFPPNTEIYCEIRSTALPGNDSTLGPTAALHKTSDANGNLSVFGVEDDLLPDFPRELSFKAGFRDPLATEQFAE